LPLLEKLAQAGRKDLILIAEDLEGEALTTLVLNKLKGVLNTVAIKAPSFGDGRKAILEDIAVLTGGQVITADRGMTFENVELDVIGTARKVIVTKDTATIIEGGGPSNAVKARMTEIANQSEASTSGYDKDGLNKRNAALGGKVAVIKVGGATETEIEEKKFRVDDAVAAVKAALDEGIVAGGGVTLLNIANELSHGSDDVFGKQLLISALEKPFRILMENSGLNPDEWLPKIRDGKPGQGVNVNDPSKLVDLKANGVVDPVRVTREAVQNAVSIAGTAMTMGALVVDVPEKDESSGGGMPGMGGMGAMM
jgi:chaperonin GroEL